MATKKFKKYFSKIVEDKNIRTTFYKSSPLIFLGMILTLLVLARCSPIAPSISKNGYNKNDNDIKQPHSDDVSKHPTEEKIELKPLKPLFRLAGDEFASDKPNVDLGSDEKKAEKEMKEVIYSANSNEKIFKELKEKGKILIPVFNKDENNQEMKITKIKVIFDVKTLFETSSIETIKTETIDALKTVIKEQSIVKTLSILQDKLDQKKDESNPALFLSHLVETSSAKFEPNTSTNTSIDTSKVQSISTTSVNSGVFCLFSCQEHDELLKKLKKEDEKLNPLYS
ncbi:MAG: hypothetical protein HY072_09900, partial [Deltaproteobacteria bacterium]|nr:hypothetical protein [Deltaproteobacteria bacterium]